MSNAKLNLNGGTCGSCAYAIEKIGRKIPGVKDVQVHSSESSLEMKFQDENLEQEEKLACVHKLQDYIKKIGYDSQIAEVN